MHQMTSLPMWWSGNHHSFSLDSDETALNAGMQEKLLAYQMQVRSDDSITIFVRGRTILKSTWDTIRTQEGFTRTKDPVIHFSGEGAVDPGGPKRKFCTWVQKSCSHITRINQTCIHSALLSMFCWCVICPVFSRLHLDKLPQVWEAKQFVLLTPYPRESRNVSCFNVAKWTIAQTNQFQLQAVYY